MILAAAVPFVALAALIGVDVATSGGAHLTRTVIHGNGPGEVLDIVRRRLIISANGLKRFATAATCAIGVLILYLGVRHRDEVLAPIRSLPAFRAAIWGALAATVAGTLANDSGPLVLEAGLLMLLLAVGYARAAPKSAHEPRKTLANRAKTEAVRAQPVG